MGRNKNWWGTSMKHFWKESTRKRQIFSCIETLPWETWPRFHHVRNPPSPWWYTKTQNYVIVINVYWVNVPKVVQESKRSTAIFYSAPHRFIKCVYFTAAPAAACYTYEARPVMSGFSCLAWVLLFRSVCSNERTKIRRKCSKSKL